MQFFLSFFYYLKQFLTLLCSYQYIPKSNSLELQKYFTYLCVINSKSILHYDKSIIITTITVKNVSKVNKRDIFILCRAEINCSAETFNSMIIIANNSPVKTGQVVKNPLRANVLQNFKFERKINILKQYLNY